MHADTYYVCCLGRCTRVVQMYPEFDTLADQSPAGRAHACERWGCDSRPVWHQFGRRRVGYRMHERFTGDAWELAAHVVDSVTAASYVAVAISLGDTGLSQALVCHTSSTTRLVSAATPAELAKSREQWQSREVPVCGLHVQRHHSLRSCSFRCFVGLVTPRFSSGCKTPMPASAYRERE